MALVSKDTIAAHATAPGRGGVGIIRISGTNSRFIAEKILGYLPKPRYAAYGPFQDFYGDAIDEGIALFFPGPHSFTGEDVFELQGHGGPVILDLLLEEVIRLGARLARPGEFSERAYLNDKIDLTQAEAIADIIEASSKQATKQALNSLQGEFSKTINHLVESLIQLRIYVEAAIDFPEEEVDFLSDGKIATDLKRIISSLKSVFQSAKQGAILREGMKVVIAGHPNAGKSSLLNALAEKDAAIVTDIAGTTRDVLREQIHIDGMPLHIIDTAGLRDSPDHVEQLGIQRAWQEIADADHILLIVDATLQNDNTIDSCWPQFFKNDSLKSKVSVVLNKIDQISSERRQTITSLYHGDTLSLSAKTGEGLNRLRDFLKQTMGFEGTTEGGFSARRRHIESLQDTQIALERGQTQLDQHMAGELLAEDLRSAQNSLSEITGKLSSDELLGKIFSNFCIGK